MAPRCWTFVAFSAALVIPALGQASSCSKILTPTKSVQPKVAPGYRMALVATGLTKPRSIKFDTAGNLLVVEAGAGITNLAFQDDGGTCLSVKTTKTVLDASELNHGLALSQDGKTLYASSPEAVYSWAYDPDSSTVGGSNKTLVAGMTTNDHTTRTLLLSQKVDGVLLINRGSTSNIDTLAEDLSSGHSQIKAFDLKDFTDSAFDFNTQGTRLGWGLRNSVGIAEHPDTGGIYSVENSADEIMREGIDVHQNNPGEEMNFHGYLNGTEYAAQGSNFGYPACFSAWKPSELPQSSNLTVGSNFAIDDQNSTVNDAFCARTSTAPRLSFQAHMAPLDIKFNNSASEAWITFHGSWDRSNPVGYKLSVLPFQDGEPVAAPDNTTAVIDVFWNADNSDCPQKCFRPVGIAFDSQGRLFVSSDATGEIYVVEKASEPSTVTSSSAGSSPTSGTVKSGEYSILALSLAFMYFFFCNQSGW